MTVTVRPGELRGSLPAIASKSAAHRQLIAAALSAKPTMLRLNATSGDIEATVRCLRAMGAEIRPAAEGLWVIPGSPADRPTLDCGESGSTLRSLLPVAAALGAGGRFSGSGRLPERPMEPLISVLKAHGTVFSADRLPFDIAGKLRAGSFELPGDVSSQFVTGLLLALPLLREDSEIVLTSPLQSAPYAELTVSVLDMYRIKISCLDNKYLVPGGQTYASPGEAAVEGDWSNAAYILAAGAIGGSVTVTGLSLTSLQGDRAILDLLHRFGAEVSAAGDAVTVSAAPLRGITADLSQTPDLLPILAVLAAAAAGESRFTGCGRLRLKESDRLAACADMITRLGGTARASGDCLTVGGGICGGAVEGYGDHRMVMAASVAALCGSGVTVGGAEAVNKSYPGFFDALTALGAVCERNDKDGNSRASQ